jgi:acyl-homoserine-lactone acylase
MPRFAPSVFTLVFSLAALMACQPSETTSTPATPAAPASLEKYQSEIRWTSYGIPHVKADDWAGLGYGYAYATATDVFCVIAKELVRMDGEMSLHFGSNEDNLASDIFHKALLGKQQVQLFQDSESERAGQFSEGYVAGYNRYMRDHAGKLPASCEGESWVRGMASADVAKLNIGLGIRYGLGRVSKEMAAAAPPQRESEVALLAHTDFDAPRGFGSNAVALGRAVTDSGRGILFGNPHYPWEGPSRFHMIHTTIPGEVDVMGVSLLTTTRVAIGFNKDIAWSHTVSTALRSTFYQLELNPDNPLQYRYGDSFRDIVPLAVTVSEADHKGGIAQSQHTVYFTHFGPVVESEDLPWTQTTAYAVRDANLANTRNGPTYDALNKARNIDEVEAAISLQGVAWTNTIAADRLGTAFYADISVTPNVDASLLERCRVRPDNVPARAVVLSGNTQDCEWYEDDRSAIPGVLPAEEMPRLKRDDYVANSNNSYWLSNPQQPLEGYSPIIGDEGTARSLRTRAGLSFIQELLAQAGKISPADMQGLIYQHRNYGAELLLDDLLTLCTPENSSISVQGVAVDITASCTVLAAWDRRNAVNSRGGHVWREFWRTGRKIEGVYSVPFDVTDPVNTPRGLAVKNEEVRTALLKALANAQRRLSDANIPLDASIAEIQFTERNGERIAVPGGEGWAGMWSMIIAELEPDKGYSPIIHGNSYMQVISWDKAGLVQPRAILTYSQSPEGDSAHNADMTELYTRSEWIDLPFTDQQIRADPQYTVLNLAE